MRLSLSFGSPWQAEHGRATLAGVVVSYGPIILQPDEPRRWIAQTLGLELPAGCRIVVGKNDEHKTSSEWPMRLVEAEVVAAGDRVVELRIAAFYSFMEHAAVALVRAVDRAVLERELSAIVAVLETGRPDWRGDPTCLVELWDLDVPAKTTRPHVDRAAADHLELERLLAEIPEQSATDQTRRGALLIELGRVDAALAAFSTAISLDPSLALAHYYRGVALGALDRHAEAVTAWQRSLELAPDRTDTLYNLGQAKYLMHDFAGALAAFEAVVRLEPDDVMVQRKVIQCLYALERHPEGEAARAAFRDAWAASADPRTRWVSEYVFDQLALDGHEIHVVETLRQTGPGAATLISFRLLRRHDGREHTLATVAVETSELARAAGTPFVLSVTNAGRYRVVGAAPMLPPYAELEKEALRLLGETLSAADR
jgi:tetratricopeptide (TPR) repeat protein